MTNVAGRYRKVAAAFTERVRGVDDAAWSNPSPCEGWVARDVVRHLVDWVPPFLASGAPVAIPPLPDVDDDPVRAWEALDSALQGILDDPATAEIVFDHPQAGTHPLDQAIAMFVLGDVLVHTWDLARAAGLDDRLDPDECKAMADGIEPMGDALAKSGHYSAATPFDAATADDQTRLLALTGRVP
jgi:uncharacterized protein (TIGR03086 family)